MILLTQPLGMTMRFTIDPSNGIPIYEQIVQQVKFAVAEGKLTSGELIPSVRELSRDLMVNPNTVQRAVQFLQSEQILEPLRGRGLAVCTGAKRQCTSDRQQLMRDRLETVVNEAVRSGLPPDKIRDLFERAMTNALSISKSEASS